MDNRSLIGLVSKGSIYDSSSIIVNSGNSKPNKYSTEELVNMPMPKFGPITNEVVEQAENNSGRFPTNVRMAMGRVWTNEEYENWRKGVLKTPLP